MMAEASSRTAAQALSDEAISRRASPPRPSGRRRIPNSQGRYECNICHKDFSTSNGLSGHMGVHARERRAAEGSSALSSGRSRELRTAVVDAQPNPGPAGGLLEGQGENQLFLSAGSTRDNPRRLHGEHGKIYYAPDLNFPPPLSPFWW